MSYRCTGYVVNPAGWIATAGHCVDPREARDDLIKAGVAHALATGFYPQATSVDQLLGLIEYRANSFDDEGHLRRNQPDRTVITSWGASVSGVEIAKSKPAFVRAFHRHEDGDAALLKVDETDLNAIPLGDSDKVNINDDVVAVGYPVVIDNYTDDDLTPTFDSGTVSSRKTVAHGLLPVLQLSAGLSGGMSGGPTVDSDGKVVGTNVSHFPGEPFNYSIPIDQVKELMDSSGVKNDLSSTTKQYRDGIAAYYAKDRATAVKNLKAAVSAQPGNGFAADFLKKSQALPKPKPKAKDNGSGALLWVLLGLLVLLLVIGGILALVLSRPQGKKPAPGQMGAPGAPGAPGMVPGRWAARLPAVPGSRVVRRRWPRAATPRRPLRAATRVRPRPSELPGCARGQRVPRCAGTRAAHRAAAHPWQRHPLRRPTSRLALSRLPRAGSSLPRRSRRTAGEPAPAGTGPVGNESAVRAPLRSRPPR